MEWMSFYGNNTFIFLITNLTYRSSIFGISALIILVTCLQINLEFNSDFKETDEHEPKYVYSTISMIINAKKANQKQNISKLIAS
jgi:hypothetical protein